MLGTQGLWPGRRWKGLEGAREALSTCRLVRVDPVDVVGRMQDLAFASRVEGYRRDHLDLLLYKERAGFEHGGASSIYPRDLLRLHRSWVQNEGLPKRWEDWYAKNKKLAQSVPPRDREEGAVRVQGVGRRGAGGELSLEPYRRARALCPLEAPGHTCAPP